MTGAQEKPAKGFAWRSYLGSISLVAFGVILSKGCDWMSEPSRQLVYDFSESETLEIESKNFQHTTVFIENRGNVPEEDVILRLKFIGTIYSTTFTHVGPQGKTEPSIDGSVFEVRGMRLLPGEVLEPFTVVSGSGINRSRSTIRSKDTLAISKREAEQQDNTCAPMSYGAITGGLFGLLWFSGMWLWYNLQKRTEERIDQFEGRASAPTVPPPPQPEDKTTRRQKRKRKPKKKS